MHLPATCEAPSCGRASDLQVKPCGPLKASPYRTPWRWVRATTIAAAEGQEMPPAETVYLLPAAMVLPASRSRQDAPVTVVVHSARGAAVCAGRAWAAATARASAAAEARASVAAAFS